MTLKYMREKFSNVDTAWYHMDSPTNLAVITGVMSFAAPLDFDRLQLTVAARVLPFDRFRQRVHESRNPFTLPTWEIDPDFNLANHLQKISLPEPADHHMLQNFVSKLMSIPLERSRPLWKFYYIENVNGGSALVARLHHCVADGIAIMQVLLSLADLTPDAPMPEPYHEQVIELSPLARLLLPAIKTIHHVENTVQSVESLVHQGMDVLVHPSRFEDSVQAGGGAVRALGKLLLIPPDQHTLLKKKCGVPKRVAWYSEIKVEEVKAVGQAMGGTINDILLSAITGALRRYLDERGQPVQGLEIRAVVPVNLRPVDELGSLGNRFGLVFLSLPIGMRDPIRRLVVLRRRMDAIKESSEAVVALGILNFIGMTPTQIKKIIVTIFGLKGSTVMTNVPGPRQQLYLAGQTISSMMFWVPAPSNLSLGISILSYAGDVILGIAADAGLIPDPERIIELFKIEFEYLQEWGRPPENS
jgi:WS/DGAT/MGAT family acyltransferase